MLKILIADKLAETGLEFLQNQPDVSLELKNGLSPAELAETVGRYDGMIVRSRTRVTAEVLQHPGKLRAIARAGVGVDNIDVQAATEAGVLVMNTPDANTISAAELTIAHMLALARHIVPACNSLKSGKWEKNKFSGRQLAGKNLGIVGLGRIGMAVAKRALGLEMTVLAYDPFVSATGLEGAATLFGELEDMLPMADVLTLHVPKTKATTNLINAERIARMKDGAMLINCARGGLVDEDALYEALTSGKLSAAALDVFAVEPPGEHKSMSLANVIATPHLGASTYEAQQAVALDAAKALVDDLRGDDVRGAVNIGGIEPRLDAYGKAMADLARRMGMVASVLCGGISEVTVTLFGQRTQASGEVLTRMFLAELLAPHLETPPNFVNAPHLAARRGIKVKTISTSEHHDYGQCISAAVVTDHNNLTIEGTVFADGLPRIMRINEYRLDAVPAGPMVLIFNEDRPGVIGLVGTTFGGFNINVADMTLSRHEKTAMMVLKLDAQPSEEILTGLRHQGPIREVHAVNLPPLKHSPTQRPS